MTSVEAAADVRMSVVSTSQRVPVDEEFTYQIQLENQTGELAIRQEFVDALNELSLVEG